MTGKTKTKCPECDGEIPNDKVSEGQIIECPFCGTESEVLQTDPLTLAPLEEEK